MQRAIDHADRVVEGWAEEAACFLTRYLDMNREPFLTGDVRLTAAKFGVPLPPDNRAWGPIINSAVRSGQIRKVGYGNSKTGHMRPMPLWQSAA